ncbi:hypothetical protein ACIPEL_15445 [Streptomyces griseoviridis]
MDQPPGLYGILSGVGGALTALGIAFINSGRGRRGEAPAPAPAAAPVPAPVPAGVEADDDPDLTTVEGIARIVLRQGRRIRQLEDGATRDRERIAAMSRYLSVLIGTIRQLGGVVPEPDPHDRDLIDS